MKVQSGDTISKYLNWIVLIYRINTRLFPLIDSGLIVKDSQLIPQIGDGILVFRCGLLLQLNLKSSFTGKYFLQHFRRALLPPLYIELLIAPILNQTNKLIIFFGVVCSSI